jgi:hypothetical protein
MVKKHRSSERSSRPAIESSSSRGADETLSFAARPKRKMAEPLVTDPNEIIDYIGVYRYQGKLRDFDTSIPEHREVVLFAMSKIRQKIKQYPDYLDFLSKEFSNKMKTIPDGNLFQRLSICSAIFLLENGVCKISEPKQSYKGSLEELADLQLISEPWETAYCFIRKRGVAQETVVEPLPDREGNIIFAATQLEKFKVAPVEGVSEDELRAFFKKYLSDKDYRKPDVMFDAAAEAEKAGLVKFVNRQTKDVPAIKLKIEG